MAINASLFIVPQLGLLGLEVFLLGIGIGIRKYFLRAALLLGETAGLCAAAELLLDDLEQLWVAVDHGQQPGVAHHFQQSDVAHFLPAYLAEQPFELPSPLRGHSC